MIHFSWVFGYIFDPDSAQSYLFGVAPTQAQNRLRSDVNKEELTPAMLTERGDIVDIGVKEQFIQLWKTYFNGAELPIAFFTPIRRVSERW
jgi:hypothetical protein